jgi:hypothetical protein
MPLAQLHYCSASQVCNFRRELAGIKRRQVCRVAYPPVTEDVTLPEILYFDERLRLLAKIRLPKGILKVSKVLYSFQRRVTSCLRFLKSATCGRLSLPKIIDIGHHVISEQDKAWYTQPSSYGDLF